MRSEIDDEVDARPIVAALISPAEDHRGFQFGGADLPSSEPERCKHRVEHLRNLVKHRVTRLLHSTALSNHLTPPLQMVTEF